MGGMGFIENNKALCMLSVLINTHMLMAAREAGVERFFYSSSACVYAHDKQNDPAVEGLVEDDAYPAMPEDGYGWEKLFSERMCRHFSEDFGLVTRVARFHNVYGPTARTTAAARRPPRRSAGRSRRRPSPATHDIEIWGDGEQTRSFTYIDDCVHGTQAIMASDSITFPINLGSSEKVTINQLVDIVEEIAGVEAQAALQPVRPQGRERPQQRQHPDLRCSAGSPRCRCASAWSRPTLDLRRAQERPVEGRSGEPDLSRSRSPPVPAVGEERPGRMSVVIGPPSGSAARISTRSGWCGACGGTAT